MILYPAIDIRGGRAVRLLRGDYERETAYDADPLDAAHRWVADGAEWLHVVDLDGAREGGPANLEHVRRIARGRRAPVQLGGGLRDAHAVATALDAGVERVVLGTAALATPRLLAAMLDEHGERVVVSVDSRDGRVAVEGWTEETGPRPPSAWPRSPSSASRGSCSRRSRSTGRWRGPGSRTLLAAVDGRRDAELICSGGVG